MLNRPEFLVAMAWAPHTFAAVLQRRRHGAWWVGLTLGLVTVVSPQMAGAHAVAALVLRGLWRRKQGWPARGAWAVGTASWALVSAPLVLPFLELLPWTDRATGLKWDAHINALDVSQLLQWVAPGALGFLPFNPPAQPALPVQEGLWMTSMTLGVLGVALALVAVSSSRRARALGLVLGVLALLGTSAVPGVAWLWTLPPLSLVRFTGKAWHVAVPLLALLGGVGLDLVHRRRNTRWPWAALLCACVMLGVVDPRALGLWLQDLSPRDDIAATLVDCLRPAVLFSGVLLSVGAWLAMARRTWLLGALAAGETVLLGAGALHGVTLLGNGEPTAAGVLREHLGDGYRLAVSTLGAGTGMPTRALLGPRTRAEQEAAEGNHPLLQGASLVASNTGVRLAEGRRVEATLRADPRRWCAATGCDAFLQPQDLPPPTGMTEGPAFPSRGLRSWLPAPGPGLASVAAVVHHVDARHLERVLLEPGVNLATDAVVTQPLEVDGSTGTVNVLELSTRRVVLEVHVTRGALVWTRHAMGPGWNVRVDGAEEDPVWVNGGMRGVVVPAGEHRVEWEHSANSLWAGVLLAALCGVWLVLRPRNASASPLNASGSPRN
jgi:hypothetical protein